MKHLFILFSIILMLMLFANCSEGDNGESTPVDVVPLFDFQSDVSMSSAPLRAIISDGSSRAEGIYKVMAPLLTGFDATNSGGLSTGDSFSVNIFDTQANFTISESGGTVIFSGTLTDGSAEITLEYDTSARTFTYEQIMIVKDPYNTLSFTPTLEAAVYSKIENASVDDNGYFHTLFVSTQYIYDEFGGPPRNYFQGGQTEIYYGEMETGQIGTGFCYVENFSGNNPDVPNFDETTIEGHLTNDKLDAYKTYLSGVDISNPPFQEGMVLYNIGDTYTLVEGSLDYNAVVNGLPTIWKNNVLLQPY